MAAEMHYWFYIFMIEFMIFFFNYSVYSEIDQSRFGYILYHPIISFSLYLYFLCICMYEKKSGNNSAIALPPSAPPTTLIVYDAHSSALCYMCSNAANRTFQIF